MVTAWLAIKSVVLVAVCSTGPGLLIVRLLNPRWSPMEKLCGVFAASFICIYLASFALFLLNAGSAAYGGASALFAAMGLSGWRTAMLLVRHRSTRSALAAWGAILCWDFLHLAMVRHYGGGGWAGDWFEHYQRTQYFLHQFSNDYLFLGREPVPARPPMMNLIAAFICRQTSINFESFSLVFLLLNAWAFLPCCLFLGFLRPRSACCITILAGLFMLNPSIVENATLTVTKELAAGLVILGLCFYLRNRIAAACTILAAAILVHYSAVPFVAAIGLHWLLMLITHPKTAARSLAAALPGTALLATWFAWSFAVFGTGRSFAASAATTGIMVGSPATNLRRMLFNLYTSIVPHPLHPLRDAAYSILGNWGQVNDYYFTMSQQTFPLMAGLTGGLIAVWLTGRILLSNRLPHPRRRAFWIFYLLFTYIAGICVNADWCEYGCAHVTLQSLSMMALTLLAAWMPLMPRWMWRAVIAGAAVDYALGILLQFDRQSYVYPTIIDAAGRQVMLPDFTLGRLGANDYSQKLQAGYVFIGDHLAGFIGSLQLLSILGALASLWMLWRLARRAELRAHLLTAGRG